MNDDIPVILIVIPNGIYVTMGVKVASSLLHIRLSYYISSDLSLPKNFSSPFGIKLLFF